MRITTKRTHKVEGPFEDTPHALKHRVTTHVPEELFEETFVKHLGFPGAQDKVMATLFKAFHDELKRIINTLNEPTPEDRVKVAVQILSQIRFDGQSKTT